MWGLTHALLMHGYLTGHMWALPLVPTFQQTFLTRDTLFSRSHCKSIDGQHPEAKLLNSLQGDTFEVGIALLIAASSSGQQCDSVC